MKKKLLSTALTFVATAVLASCGNQEETFKPALDTNTKCSIKIIGSYDSFEALEAEFDRFSEYYPGVELQYVKGDDYNNTLATVLEGNDKPNIFFSYTWMNGNEKYASVVEHMEELSNSALKLNLDCIRPGIINRDTEKKVFMVPIFSRTYGALVNTDLFKKEGINVPSTWKDLLVTCKAFSDKGYASPMMGFSLNSSSCWMNTVAYPMFVADLANNPDALDRANKLDPTAGEYMRNALTAVDQLTKNGCIDGTECDKIADNYKKVLLRFFEGDVPMMICTGDTVSGTPKREKESQAFIDSPFNYSFYPIPVTEKGGYFIDSPSIQFSVNKYCDNLDMTNEFMRFLVSNKELNNMASIKRLGAPTKVMSSDPIYAPFGNIPTERTFSPEALGVKDPLAAEIRTAAFKVGKGQLTIDEAIAMYGHLNQ